MLYRDQLGAAVERTGSGRYGLAMRSFTLRLIALFAILLMPLGMPVAAAHSLSDAQMTSMPMEHCPAPPRGTASHGACSDCTIACSAALPGSQMVDPELALDDAQRLQPGPAQRLFGIHAEISTPPPRLS